ncbi:MAG TPA: amidohydrolase family protein [Rugosimonospora sp.]
MIVDAHCHAWRTWPYSADVPDPPHRGSVDQLLYEMDRHGVGATLVVCAQIGDGPTANPENNNDVAQDAHRLPDRLAFLLDVDNPWSPHHHQPGAARRLRALVARFPHAVGFTHYLGEVDDGWLTSQNGDEFFGAAEELGLIASISAPPAWQPALQRVAAAHPGLVLLIHHLGWLSVSAPGYPDDLAAVLAGAEYGNVFVKVSGFYYASAQPWDFPYRDTWPAVRDLVSAYGSERLMWGSDFPASLGKATYTQSLEMVRTVLPFLSQRQRDQILGGTLTRLLAAARSPVIPGAGQPASEPAGQPTARPGTGGSDRR